MASTNVLIAFYSRTWRNGGPGQRVSPRARPKKARRCGCAGLANSSARRSWRRRPAGRRAQTAMNARYPAPTADDAAWADAIVFGTPTRFGNALGGVEGLYRQPGRPLVPGQAQRQGWRRLRLDLDPAWRQ